MRCPRCQQENPPQAKFCLECATPLALRCTNCGTPLPAAAKFCLECATPVSAPGSPPRLASPEAYTPKHLAERILSSKTALEGERKQVTVLFADLKGSMELLSDRDPEEARKLLDPVIEHMMEAVHRYEGTVNQVMGDGIMALFGAPLAHEDHAVRACYAALRMQESVTRFADDVRRAHGVSVQVRTGLNSGEVVVRAIGSDLHMDYTAVGRTTHLAARMEQLASPGSILMTPTTLGLAEGYVEVTPLGPVPVKGVTDPIEVYVLKGAVSARSRFHVAAARGLTRFVGRAQELEQLAQGLERARAGQGHVVAVVGDAGVGKSRLYWEFSRSHRTRDCLVLAGSSVSYGKASAWLPTIDLLKAYFQIEVRDEPRKIREKVTGKLFSLDRALEPALPPLRSLLDVPAEDTEWERLAPPQRRQRTLDAVKRLLLRESRVQPLLVVFEDLHWIDAETQALLDSLVESLPTARLLLLVNYRPEYQHGWSSKSYYRQLRIDPLRPESAGALLEGLLGNDTSLDPLKRLLIDRTEGNPFFLEESVRTLVETKVLTGERGAYRLARAITTLQIPPTAQTMLGARIDRLAPEDKRLLQAASVIGKDVPVVLLQAVADEPEEQFRRGLANLQAAEFLYEARLFPDLEYTFKHALTHDVAYGSLLQERRQALHARIMAALEALAGDRIDEHTERLAHHAFRGEVWDKALRYFRQAGIRATRHSAHREAVANYEQALEALRHLPETRDTREQAIDLRLGLRNSLFALAELGEVIDHLREAEAVCATLDDPRQLGAVIGCMAHYFWITGDQDRALEFGERALAIARARGDARLGIETTVYLGQAHHALGDYRRAMDVLRETIDGLDNGDLGRHRFGVFHGWISRVWLIWCLAEIGDFAEGVALAGEMLRGAEAADNLVSRIGTSFGAGHLHLRHGNLDQAIAVFDRGLGLCKAGDIPLWSPWLAGSLGAAYVRLRRIPQALELLERAVAETAARKIMAAHPLLLGYLGQGYLEAGRIQDAADLAEHALGSSRLHRERGHEAWSLRLLGEIAARRDAADVAHAATHYGNALSLADTLGMRPLVAHCHLGLGTLYRRTGKREPAHEHLSTAATMYRQLGMTYWLEQAGAELE